MLLKSKTTVKRLYTFLAPVLIVLAGCSGAGLPLVPALLALCFALGSVWAAGLSLAVLLALYTVVLGKWALAVGVYLLFCLLAVAYGRRSRLAQPMQLLYGCLLGMQGAVGALAVVSLLGDMSASQLLSETVQQLYLQSAQQSMLRVFFDAMLSSVRLAESMTNAVQVSYTMYEEALQGVLQLPLAQRAQQLGELVLQYAQLQIPAILVRMGLLGGALGYYAAAYTAPNKSVLPPRRWVLPKWITLPMVLLWIGGYVATLLVGDRLLQFETAIQTAAELMFAALGVCTVCFLLHRKQTKPIWVAVIVLATVKLLGGIYAFLGIVDTTFGVRRWLCGMDFLKARNLDPNTETGLTALRDFFKGEGIPEDCITQDREEDK